MGEVFAFCAAIKHKSRAHWDLVSFTERQEYLLSGQRKGIIVHKEHVLDGGRDRENHESERLCLFEAPISSDTVEKMEAELMNILHQVKQAGGSASLTFTTTGGKFKELGAPSSTSSGLSPSLPATATAPGGGRRRRRRHRGPAAMVKSQARAAAHQASLASAEVNAPPASSPPRPPRPLHHLLSPSPSRGRRRVMSLGRPEMPTFSSLNLDGESSPSPSPPPTTPLQASPTPPPAPPSLTPAASKQEQSKRAMILDTSEMCFAPRYYMKPNWGRGPKKA